jgi:serine/threonine-protein kinase
VASALDYAHQQGVIHRDIKPENVLLHAGEAMVADFGIALALSAAGGDRLTETGLSLGTPEYMSPEQASGAKEVDARSDIYSLGCVLYEMLGGDPPFTGHSQQAVIARQVLDPPPSLSTVRPSVPAAVEAVITQALAKAPADRFATVGQFAEVLDQAARAEPPQARRPVPRGRRHRGWIATIGATVALIVLLIGSNAGGLRDWLAGGPPSASAPDAITSLAVLPFENLTGDDAYGPFADGMTEELTTELGQIRALKVISRSSARAVADARLSLPEIGTRLGVGGIVEASLLGAGQQVRVALRVYDAASETQIWGDTYERPSAEIQALYADVARAVARELQAPLTTDEQSRLARSRSVEPAAQEAYLRGRYHEHGSPGWQRAIELHQRAVEIDPGFAEARAALANLLVYGLPSRDYMPQARTEALRALEIDQTVAEAHAALARVKFFFDWDWSGAEQEFRRALDLDPSSSAAHQGYGNYLWAMGRFDEALTQLRRAWEHDPVSLNISTEIGRTLYFQRRYEDAIRALRHTLELDPEFYWGRFFLGITYEQLGMYEEAATEIIAARRVVAGDELADQLASRWREFGYEGFLRAWIEGWKAREEVQPTSMAMLYARVGEVDEAFRHLERAYEERTRALVYLKIEPQFDRLRDDPRYDDLVRRMGFPE